MMAVEASLSLWGRLGETGQGRCLERAEGGSLFLQSAHREPKVAKVCHKKEAGAQACHSGVLPLLITEFKADPHRHSALTSTHHLLGS